MHNNTWYTPKMQHHYYFYLREVYVHNLLQDRNLIGRDKYNSIALSDTQVSKNHAIITNRDGNYWIEDCKSKNGVFINGKKINNQKKLIHGCLLKIGSTILRFETKPII